MPRQSIDDVQIPGDDRLDARSPNLDDDPLPGAERRRVHLSDRCGGERGAVKALKHVVYLSAKPGPQHLLDLWPRNLRCVVLQAAELVNKLGRQQVTTGREDLPEFDEVTPPSSSASRSDRASATRPSRVCNSARRAPRKYGSMPRRSRILLIWE